MTKGHAAATDNDGDDDHNDSSVVVLVTFGIRSRRLCSDCHRFSAVSLRQMAFDAVMQTYTTVTGKL